MTRTEILQPWLSGNEFAVSFLNPGPNNSHYLTKSEVKTEIIKTYLNGLHLLRDRRLAGPLGMRRGVRQKSRAAFEKSGLSLAVLRTNIEGLRNLFISSGMADWIGTLEPGLDKAVLSEFKLALTQMGEIPVSLGQAARNPALKSKLIAMEFPLKHARGTIGIRDASNIAPSKSARSFLLTTGNGKIAEYHPLQPDVQPEILKNNSGP